MDHVCYGKAIEKKKGDPLLGVDAFLKGVTTMKLLSTLMKLRESLLIRDPFIFKWVIHRKPKAVYHTVNRVGQMQVFVSNPVSVWLNRYVFVKFRLPFSYIHSADSCTAYAVVGKHGNYRFIPFMIAKEPDNVADLLAYRPIILHEYMESEENMKDIMKAFD